MLYHLSVRCITWKSRQSMFVFCCDQNRFQTPAVGITPLHMSLIKKKRCSLGSLVPGSAGINWTNYSHNITSYSICLDLKWSNTSNHRWPMSVLRRCIIVIGKYQKRPNEAMQLIIWIAFCPALDFWSETGTFWWPKGNIRDFGTEYPKLGLSRGKPGRLVSLANDIITNSIVSGIKYCHYLLMLC